jgi:integrase
MSLSKQAKVLRKGQVEAVLNYLAGTRYPVRNRVIFLLSTKAGLRAKEIASLTWDMITDAGGGLDKNIHLSDKASKGKSGRAIPMNDELWSALSEWKQHTNSSGFVISTERSERTSPQVIVNLFARWYQQLEFIGCSSHSGRRTFITNTARKISMVGGSLRDIQLLAGHSNLQTTQRYIEADVDAQRKVVQQI